MITDLNRMKLQQQKKEASKLINFNWSEQIF